MASTSCKRTCLKLSDKVKIIDEVELGAGVTQLAKKYGVSKATICKIKRLKTQILKRTCNSFEGLGNRKTLKNAKAPKMENSLYKWFLKQREKHVPISGEIIKERAKLLNQKLKETQNFVASDGWLQRFKTRYGIRLLSTCAEKLSTQPQLVLPFKEKLMNTIKELDLRTEQIYNAHESGLYWKMLPEESYATPLKKPVRGRNSDKQQIMLLACTNADGSHKIKPMIVGKENNPCSLKNLNIPVHYNFSKTAWMTRSIFQKWFHKHFIPEVENFLKKRKLPIKALLLLDNAPSHPPDQQLKNKNGSIFVMYMPNNVIPLIQSMEENVIRLTKQYYQKFLLSYVLSNNPENIFDALKEVTLREAVLNLHMAWNAVNQQTIQKCWNNILCTSDQDENDAPLSVIKEKLPSNADVLVNASLDVVDLLKIVNSNIVCTPADINLWNEDRQMSNVNKEEDMHSEDDGDIPIEVRMDSEDDEVHEDVPIEVRIGNEDVPSEVKSIVTDAQAVQIFNQALDWAEKKEVSYTDILVLRKLQAQAIEDSANCQFTETRVADFFPSN